MPQSDKGIIIPTSFKIPGTLKEAEPQPQISIIEMDQTEDAWCYAACAQMAIQHTSQQSVEQCEVAGFAKSEIAEIDCCPPSNDPQCTSSGCRKDQLAPILANWDVSSQDLPTSILLDAVADEIDANRVIEAVIDWTNVPGQQSSHAVLISGVNGQRVHVVDPLQTNLFHGWTDIAHVQNGLGNGDWSMTLVQLEEV
jgi:hypothetical protein